MQSVLKIAQKAALSEANVLICGETGTGKELIAQSIHNASRQAKGQFIAINCSAIPETLLEGLLFGTSKGAFTGAADHPGLFELAQEGTVFLDEINSMAQPLQAKLLRVLQEKEVQRLGEKILRPINCRVLSALNRDPLEAIKNKELREDIFFRLAAVSLNLPPLRKRPEDIIALATGLGRKIKADFNAEKMISPSAKKILLRYPWPGNVRELEHAIQYALTMLDKNDKIIDIAHLPARITTALESPDANHGESKSPQRSKPRSPLLKEALFEYEYNLVAAALKKYQGHLTKSAASLGLSRQTLSNRIKSLKALKKRYKAAHLPPLQTRPEG